MSFEAIPQIARRRLTNHFTASALVIENKHILLVHHKRIGAWLPPGGHIEPDEMPHEAALREVLEETGVICQILSLPRPNTGKLENFFLPQPLCMHVVEACENGLTLHHLDLVYVCKPVASGRSLPAIDCAKQEVHDALWVAWTN